MNNNRPTNNPFYSLLKLISILNSFQECTLKQIMDQESEIVHDTQSLHSDMQTLVYENYNKFIAGTDTIRKMKNDFKKMEDEMDLLAKNMESITSFSEQISCTLQDTRQKITKLSGVHSLLKRLQFLFKLPAKLKDRMQDGQYAQQSSFNTTNALANYATEAVQEYIHARRVLHHYSNMPSFQGIQADCEAIVEELKLKLREQFKSKDATAKELAESVDLLLQLKEPASSLCAEFLSHASTRLTEQLTSLQSMDNQAGNNHFFLSTSWSLWTKEVLGSSVISVLWWPLTTTCSSNGHEERWKPKTGWSQLSEITVNLTFIDDLDNFAVSQLSSFVSGNMERYFQLVQERIEKEQDGGDTAVLVRALDRFHRRLQAMNTLFTHSDFARTGTDIVLRAGRRQCRFHLQTLKIYFSDTLSRVRQTLAAPKLISQDGDSSSSLSELLTSLVLATVEKVKGILQDLLLFSQPDLTFGLKPHFREGFCIDNVREELVVGFFHHLTATARSFCNIGENKAPPALLLLLSKMCLEFEGSSVHYLLSQTDEWFNIEDRSKSGILTTEGEICSNMRAAAQELLNHYVRTQGLGVSQMLRKSVETRDWLHTIEPRTVRAVMKRVVEDIAAVDSQVGALYEEGQRTEHSSDSSRRTHSVSVSRHAYRSNWSTYTPSHLDSSLVTNMQKLFSERIEIFSSVDFSKVSVLTGIIKISLKTFLECVRLRTFSRYGLQQIQVDTHYLQLYLWRFVTDENPETRYTFTPTDKVYITPTDKVYITPTDKVYITPTDIGTNLNTVPYLFVMLNSLVHFLLDEILGSAVHRCLEPVLMEPSVVDIICERG
uniref:Vacuolar protein sorting-associated protein 51 homolog n=2 Tax=Timema TaxID=61471 RepID=A0A7R8VN71_TIMDO|nr:unnamed protein product [Timema douglasi]